MFTQSMYFRVSVIQNEVKDLTNVSCEVPCAGSFTYVLDDKILWVNCYIISFCF